MELSDSLGAVSSFYSSRHTQPLLLSLSLCLLLETNKLYPIDLSDSPPLEHTTD